MNQDTKPLRCLLIEDSEDDARLILRELREAGFEVTSERVDTPEAMREALTRDPWDIVLSDYQMPHFGGIAALEQLQATGLDLPFIIVSGTIGEEVAVAAMKAGAHDYLWKDRMSRLGPAVRREVANAKNRSAHRQAEVALREGAERLRAILDTAMDGFWLVELREGRLAEVNQTYCRMSGYGVEELLGRPITDFEAPETSAEAAEHMLRVVREGEDRFETKHRRKDGSVFDVEISVQFRSGKGGRLVCFLHDITARKQAEEAVRASLQEKEALLREVHHRVKNNLQVITSLLRLEASRAAGADALRVLKEMQGRVMSMALLHETLYRTGVFGAVDLANYLQQLASQLFRAHLFPTSRVALALDLSSVQTDIDHAIPCGLIVNELLANALKHAFPEGQSGEVKLSLHQDLENVIRMEVSDTGVGLPADFEARRGKSLGLQLVSDLARQLRGTLEVRPGPGAGFTVIFTARAAHWTGEMFRPKAAAVTS